MNADLIERLLGGTLNNDLAMEAASALTTAQAEIERLNMRVSRLVMTMEQLGYKVEFDYEDLAVKAEIKVSPIGNPTSFTADKERIKRLEEGLAPLMLALDEFGDQEAIYEDSESAMGIDSITFGDLRRARALLAPTVKP